MKKIILLSMLVLIVLLVTACGSPTPVTTQAPVATEAPLQSKPAETVNSSQVMITLADNTIDASQTTFQAGAPYTFVITNEGRRAHNFNINPPVSVAGSLDAALNSALLIVKQNELGASSSVTVEYTFPESAIGQQLEFSCLIRKHYEDKMFLAITVTK
jgi:uncharacterized cupredoxin-like copper-binding protein